MRTITPGKPRKGKDELGGSGAWASSPKEDLRNFLSSSPVAALNTRVILRSVLRDLLAYLWNSLLTSRQQTARRG